jgi:hypothetical protein
MMVKIDSVACHRTDVETTQNHAKPVDPCLQVQAKFGANPLIEEICGENLKLYGNQKWVIWENIDFTNKKGNDWHQQQLRVVAWFDNMINFHQAWNSIPHANISDVMYDANTQQFNM